MKSVYIIPLSLLLWGCTADDFALPPESSDSPIAFTAAIEPMPVSRASSPLIETARRHVPISGSSRWLLASGTALAPEARARKVDTEAFHDDFAVWSFLDDATPYIDGDIVSHHADSWQFASTRYWPSADRRLSFVAVAPASAEGLQCARTSDAGVHISYEVPSDITLQRDLTVASTSQLAMGDGSNVNLEFSHLLTAVRVILDPRVDAELLTVTVSGVDAKGDYDTTEGTWSTSSPASFSFEPSALTANASGSEELLMMLPQTLGAEATLSATLSDGSSFSAPIAGLIEWAKGVCVTYKIAPSSTDYIFEVSLSEFTADYQGNSTYYNIVSYGIKTDIDGNATEFDVPWSIAQTGGDDDYAQMLADFVTEGSGSVTNLKVEITPQTAVITDYHNDVLKQAAPISGTYNLSTCGGTTLRNTANCYIVNAPGRYTFPLVYGNAIKNGEDNPAAYTNSRDDESTLHRFFNHKDVYLSESTDPMDIDGIKGPWIPDHDDCTPGDAILLWEDAEGLLQNVSLTDDSRGIVFTVPQENITQGNAVISLRNTEGTVLWSWQIWVTDFVPNGEIVSTRYWPDEPQHDGVVQNTEGPDYIFMGTSLGECFKKKEIYYPRHAELTVTQSESGYTSPLVVDQTRDWFGEPNDCTTYQHGRSVAFPGLDYDSENGQYNNKPIYTAPGYELNYVGGWITPYTYSRGIRNPLTFYWDGSSNRWYRTQLFAKSGNSKFVYFMNLWNNYEADDYSGNLVWPIVKTVYDPSPVGYCVPPEGAFYGATLYKSGPCYWQDLSNDAGNINTPEQGPTWTIGANRIARKGGLELYRNKATDKYTRDPSGGTYFIYRSGYLYKGETLKEPWVIMMHNNCQRNDGFMQHLEVSGAAMIIVGMAPKQITVSGVLRPIREPD